MRFIRIASFCFAALVAGAAAWIVGGNALAARREREVSRAFEGTFGPRAALEAKYVLAAANADAKKAEDLSRAVGYDIGPRKRRSAGAASSVPEAERAAVSEYVAAQVGRGDATVETPSLAVASVLSSRRAALSALEDALAAGSVPRWAVDPRADIGEHLEPNVLGHLQVQRLLIADALASAARGENGAASRTLDASWKLNEGLASRPEVTAKLIAIAVARYEAGALRKIDVSADVWKARLAAMGSRARLVEALVIEHRGPADAHAWYRRMRPDGVGWWGHNLVFALEEPGGRLADAAYGEAFRRALAELRDEPAFREAAPEPAPSRDTTAILMSIVMPNIRESFGRADRLALDAELTEKVLRTKAARAATGAWPPPSAEVAASRFPGLAWNYSVEGGTVTIALNRGVPHPKVGLVLPTSFSARAPAP